MDDELKRESKGCRMEDGRWRIKRKGGKMNCKEIKEYIFDYLLGELDSVSEMRVNEHLLRCERCQKEVTKIETLFERMNDKKEIAPDKKVYQLIQKRIGIERRYNVFTFLNRPVKLYYAVATLFLGVFLMSVTNLVIEKRKVKPEETKLKYKTMYESPSSDSIVFYTAPSHRLGGT
ncbi:MAG: zf-HC2 domain-containing protein [Candidatus Cloacimonadota bacterium]|nr:MAG: zf-HC2 domain-containing protein [Candidatus Cloacimonadota bacterium]